MAQAVLVYEGKGAEFATHAKKWQDQWVHAEAKYSQGEVRTSVEMPLHLDWVKYVTLIAKACKTAGKGGQLLLLVGHGGDVTTLAKKPGVVLSAEQELSVGMFDLGPCQKIGKAKKCDFRMETEDIFYDFAPQSSVARSISPLENDLSNFATASFAQKAAIRAKFMEYIKYRLVGHCAQGNGLRQIVLLNCNVGNATDFMQKVANDWQLPVVAFMRRLETREEPDSKFVRMYAFGEAHNTGSNQHAARYNYPQMHARTFKPNAPASLPINIVYNWLYPPKQTGPASSAPPAKGKPVGAGVR